MPASEVCTGAIVALRPHRRPGDGHLRADDHAPLGSTTVTRNDAGSDRLREHSPGECGEHDTDVRTTTESARSSDEILNHFGASNFLGSIFT